MRIPNNYKEYLMLGAVSWVGYYLRTVPEKVINYVDSKLRSVVEIYDTNDMYEAFRDWYFTNYPNDYKRVEALIKSKYQNGRTNYNLILESLASTRHIMRDGHRIYISKERIEIQGKNSSYKKVNLYVIHCFTSKTVIKEMIDSIYEEWKSKQVVDKGIRVVVTDKWNDSSTIYVPVYKRLDQMFIEGKEELINDITTFLAKKSLYEEYGVRFKRSYCLYGPGGTGKTSMVFAIAHWLERPIYYLNPSGFSSDDAFEEFVGEVEANSIVLIEDIDVFWTDRESEGNTKVSFQSLLNTLDGVHSPNDVLIFTTTNHMEKLDDALVRKGRMDYKLYMGYTSLEIAESYVSNFYKEPFKFDTFPDNIPMVDIQDLCLKNDTLKDFINKFKQNYGKSS